MRTFICLLLFSAATFAFAQGTAKTIQPENQSGRTNQIMSYDSTRDADVQADKARGCLAQGNAALAAGRYEAASLSYRKALSFDSTLYPEISGICKGLQKDPLPYAALSVVPGLGQMVNGKTTNGVIQMSLFAGFLAEGLHLQHRFDTEKGISESPFLTVTTLKTMCFAAAGVLLIYSVFDSYSDIEAFNRMFTISKPGMQLRASTGVSNTLFSIRVAI